MNAREPGHELVARLLSIVEQPDGQAGRRADRTGTATGLSPKAIEALRACMRLGDELGLALYLVGGSVRDLLLERAQIDVDLAMESVVTPLARLLAAETGGRAVLHERFGTASVSGQGFRLDLAQTRRETYQRPGALPAVDPVESILDDLGRRDFTINAMALRLTGRPELIDPHAGVFDLEAGFVRVLHEHSFQDDATRMLRACRYAARLGFAIEPATRAWLQRDLPYLASVSGPRLRRELVQIFEEPCAVDAVRLLAELDVLSAAEPHFGLGGIDPEVWRRALFGPHYAPLDELGFCLLTNPAGDDDIAAVAGRLSLKGRIETALRDLVRLRSASDKLAMAVDSPSDSVELLDGQAKAAVWALSLLDRGDAGRTAAGYLGLWQHVQPLLGGKDLLALGFEPGERVGEVLRRLRQARLDGEVMTRADELRLATHELGVAEKDG